MSQLSKFHEVAILLHQEKIVGEDTIEKITGEKAKKLSFKMKLQLVLSDIVLAIGDDYNVILIFAKICTHTGNENLGDSILRDCSKLLLS